MLNKKVLISGLMLGIFVLAMAPAVTTSAQSDLNSRAKYISINSPSDGDTVSGSVTISISAWKIPKIYIDGVYAGRTYTATWDTTTVSNGAHTILAVASVTDSVTVYVDNGATPDTEAPSVSITGPSGTVSGTVSVTWSASDNIGVTSQVMYIDGVQKDTASPYSWDTTGSADGAHTILVEAEDAAGNTGSDSITVTVDNTVTPPPPPEDNELTDGVTAYGNLATVDDSFTWIIEVGADASNMHVVLNCGNDDFDIFASHLTDTPTHSNNEFEGYTTGGEDINYAFPAAGIWYIVVDAYSGDGDYDLTVTLTSDEPFAWGDGGKYALVVGISDYASISDLSYCDEDATDWYYYLVGQGYTVMVLGDAHSSNYPVWHGLATESAVRGALMGLAAHAQAGDTVVFTTSGHGSGDGDGSSFLCMYDCSGTTGCYYDTEIAADLGQFAMGVNLFFFVDHCYSGGIGPEVMALSNVAYIYMTTTCTEDGYGWDDGSANNGAWTYEFLEKYLVDDPNASMESIFDLASASYPHTGGDAAMEFDGNPSVYFYL